MRLIVGNERKLILDPRRAQAAAVLTSRVLAVGDLALGFYSRSC
jgi:hypothetical protein